jgi:D-psicose/D-tagatose/L-ribulose 3-epimerase
MKFGVNSLLFTDTFLEKDLALLEHVRELGFDTLEITPVDPDRFPAKGVAERARVLGMSVNANFALPADANPISPDPDARKRSIELSKKVVDLCVAAGVEIYCGSNYVAWKSFTGKRRTEEEWTWGVEAYREIAQYARERSDLVLGVETLNRFESYFINTAADACRFVDDVGEPNAKVHLDTFHMIREENDIGEAIRATGDRLCYFHCCGSHRGIPGRDLVPWESTFAALRDVRYDYCLTIESFNANLPIGPAAGIWRDFADSPEQLATEGLAFIRPLYERQSAAD